MAILLVVTSSIKFVADTEVGSRWLYSEEISLRRVRELSFLTDTGDPQKIDSKQADPSTGSDLILLSLV